jgi:hypothetical protein
MGPQNSVSQPSLALQFNIVASAPMAFPIVDAGGYAARLTADRPSPANRCSKYSVLS